MIRKGSKVKWKWGQGEAEGKVVETSSDTISKTIKGNKVTRHGESGNKALVIQTDEGDTVLKLESEISKQ